MLAVAVVVALVGLVRPARVVLAAGLLGLTCRGVVCTDAATRLDEAVALYDDALAATTARLGPAPAIHRVVFCTSDACFHRFTSGGSTATTIADLGIVVGPSGWRTFYVRHELVHHWQAVRLGLLARYRDPRWLIEGMAYTLSDDPRPTLVEPDQAYRAAFVFWAAQLPAGDLWPAAAQVRPGR